MMNWQNWFYMIFISIILAVIGIYIGYYKCYCKDRGWDCLPSIILWLVAIVYGDILYYIFKNDPMKVTTKHAGLTKTAGVIGIIYIIFVGMVFHNKRVYNIDDDKKDSNNTLTSLTLKFFTFIGTLVAFNYGRYLFGKYLFYSNSGLSQAIAVIILIISLIIAVMISLSIFGTKLMEIIEGIFPYYSIGHLIVKIIFYIPCLLLDLLNKIRKEYRITQKPERILILIEVILLIIFFNYGKVRRKLLVEDGMILQRNPIYLNSKKDLGSFQDLKDDSENLFMEDSNKDEKDIGIKIPFTDYSIDGRTIVNRADTPREKGFKYNYAISCWIYIDSRPPNTSIAYTRCANLLNYGNKPGIVYFGKESKIGIVMQENILKDQGTKLEGDLNLIYKSDEIKLQKWNNVIVNYNGGTLDIFLNSTLVSSNNGIIPYADIDNIIIGEENGIHGGICSVIYYPKALEINKIEEIFNSYKNKKIPII